MEKITGFKSKYSLGICSRKEDLCNIHLGNSLKYTILKRTAIALEENLLLYRDNRDFFLCHNISDVIGLGLYLENTECANIFKYLYMFRSDILIDEQQVVWFNNNEERLWALLFAAEMYRLDSINEISRKRKLLKK